MIVMLLTAVTVMAVAVIDYETGNGSTNNYVGGCNAGNNGYAR